MSAAVEAFWGDYQVGGPYRDQQHSREALEQRNALYPGLFDLMPVNYPGKSVLDYGCGPGHDTLMFLENGATKVYGVDISPKALDITYRRLKMHGLVHRWTSRLVNDLGTGWLPVVDHIHCAGVLHHTSNPAGILQSFAGALGDDAEIRLMVYDGDYGPPPHWTWQPPRCEFWTQADMTRIAEEAGLGCEYLGTYGSADTCYGACYRMRRP